MKYIPVIFLIIILILPAITLLGLRKEIGLNQTTEGEILFFYGVNDYRFTFLSPKENLSSIVLKLKNISIRNSKPVSFSLLENQEVIRQLHINGSNIGDPDVVRFAFAEIKNSKNVKYSVILSSPETEKNEALGIHTNTLNNPVIITYHIPTSRLQLISGVYKNFVDKILADKIFFITWIILFDSIVFIIKSIDI